MLLASGALFVFQSVNFRETYVRDMEALANMFSDNSAVAVTFNDAKTAEEILGALKAKPRILGAEIQLLDGATLARYGREDAGLKLSVDGLGNAAGHQFMKDSFVLAKAIDLDGKRIGTLRLWSDYGADYRALLQLYSVILVTVLGFSLGLSFILFAGSSALFPVQSSSLRTRRGWSPRTTITRCGRRNSAGTKSDC